MPFLPGNPLGVGIGMNRQDFGMTLRARRVRVDVQLPEIPPQRLLLVRIELLIAEEQHLMGGQRGMQILDLPVAEGGGQVDVGHLRAENRGHRVYLDCCIAHRLYSLWKTRVRSSMLSRGGASGTMKAGCVAKRVAIVALMCILRLSSGHRRKRGRQTLPGHQYTSL